MEKNKRKKSSLMQMFEGYVINEKEKAASVKKLQSFGDISIKCYYLLMLLDWFSEIEYACYKFSGVMTVA